MECTEAGGLGTWRGGQDNSHPCHQTMHGFITIAAVTSKYNPPTRSQKDKRKGNNICSSSLVH